MRAVVLTGIVAVALGLGACRRAPDVQQMADGALQSVELNDEVDAKYDKDARVVHLSGTVKTDRDRDRANDVVRASIGDLAQVANEIVVEGPDEKLADDLDAGIVERFETMISETPALKGVDVDITTENGVATLTGQVRTEAEKKQLDEVTKAIPGVKQVVNAITINPKLKRPAPD